MWSCAIQQVRGRIYLPQEDMAKFGVTEQQILNGKMDDNYRALVKHLIARARAYYAESDSGIPMLAPGSRMAVQAAGDMYSKILDKVTRAKPKPFHAHPSLSYTRPKLDIQLRKGALIKKRNEKNTHTLLRGGQRACQCSRITPYCIW